MQQHNVARIFLFTAIMAMVVFIDQAAWAQGRDQLLTDLLNEHVSNGQVNYGRLCTDGRLGQYTGQLNITNPDVLSTEDERFAFWLNAYTAYSLSAICAKYPIDSVNDLHWGGMLVAVATGRSIWDKPLVKVNGRTYTLKEVDHEILRKQHSDPRIQFAIACGAIGCGPVPEEAYQASRIQEQLDRQAKAFINDPQINRFDISKRRAKLSPLFKWSQKDFGKNDRDVLTYVAKYLPVEVSQSIMADPRKWDIKYGQYDLTLNDIK